MASYLFLKSSMKTDSDDLSPSSNRNIKKVITWDKDNTNNQDIKQKSHDDVLRRRKERFGEVSPLRPKYAKVSKPVMVSNVHVSSLNLLKKRRERFGENVSTLLKKIEEKEKLLKRQARFSNKSVLSTEIADNQNNVKVSEERAVFSPGIKAFQTIDQIDEAEAERKRRRNNEA